MLGCDIRKMNDETRKLVTNRDLIRINQDAEARPPMATHHMWNEKFIVMMKHLDDGTYALGFFNMDEGDGDIYLTFSDFGLPSAAGYDVETRDILDGGEKTAWREYMRVQVKAHDCKMYIARLVKR